MRRSAELWVCVPQPSACHQTSAAVSGPLLLTPHENWLLHARAKLVILEQTDEDSVIAIMTNTVLNRKFMRTY